MKLDLKSKLLLLTLFPTVVILVLSLGRINYDIGVKKDLYKTKKQITTTKEISSIIHFMQKERGYSSGYLADQNTKKTSEFLKTRKSLDASLKHFNEIPSLKEDISQLREKVDSFNLSSSQSSLKYTILITKLLDKILIIPTTVDNLEDRNYLQAYSYIALSKEYLGRIRATLQEAYANKLVSDKNYIQTKISLKMYQTSVEKFEKVLHNESELLAFYEKTLTNDSINEMFLMINSTLGTRDALHLHKWFDVATKSIDFFQLLEVKLFEKVQKSIDEKIEDANQNIVLIALALFILLVVLAYLMFTIVKKILSSAHMLNEEFESSLVLLEQYKETVDKSFIISKTNPNGIISYVNEAFCDISGYTEEELLGKSHNIIRHKDTPKHVFKDMWHNIKDLKTSWSGEIKNLAKDGTCYWMRVFINPILDRDGNVVEYIAMRTDITEIQEDKERIRDTLGITTADFTEARQQAKEYENAIDATWSVVRTDTKNIITYANDTFVDVSGYDREELIGLDCSLFRDKKHIKEGDCEKIKQELSHKKIVRMQFENIAKDNSSYFMDTTIVPITNAKGKIIEHLQLMNDVTELVLIHQEIEKTQQEIIYLMGEIGESRSKETGNHVRRVANYAKILALKAGFDEAEAELISDASPMHDIGKVAIPDKVLLKPESFEPHEWEIMKKHSEIGYKVLSNSQRSLLKASAVIAHEHHEKYDGTGYPRAITGEEIHIYARIVAIADVFDALGNNRVYKKRWPLEKIVEFFKEQRGKHFDPKLVDLFLNNLEEFIKIKEKYED
jgi:PAS domain S-box-containing protein